MPTLQIDAQSEGRTLADIARELLGGATWKTAKKACHAGRLRIDGVRVEDPGRRLQAGERVTLDARDTAATPRTQALEIELRYEDAHLLVVEKPAGIASVPYAAGDRDTLQQRLQAQAGRRSRPLGVVQRLDKETSGLLVFARSALAEGKLRHAFRRREIRRSYLALVHGEAQARRHESLLVPNRGDGLRGSLGHLRRWEGRPPPSAKRAVTEVEVLEALAGATLIRCRLKTGRQHQIRIHLAEAGHPLLGERVYIRDFARDGGEALPAPRLMLHATTLGFAHPVDGRALDFESPPPADFASTVAALRAPSDASAC